MFLLLISFFGFNYFVPIGYRNYCKDKNVFRYQFAIYQLDTTFTKNEPKKIGGLKEYFGLAKADCLDSIEIKHDLNLKAFLDSANKTEDWKLLKCGLYINNKGELGFKNYYTIGEKALYLTRYSKRMNWDDGATLNSVIDTASFKQLSGSFYKDKNHIYQSYSMSGGTALWIFKEADYKTFSILNEYYAKDKNHIYDYRNGIIDSADVKTFKVLDDAPFAKDKKHLYNWSDIIDGDTVNEDSTVLEMIKKLKQLK